MVSALMIDLRSFSDFAECHLSENDLIAYLIMIKSKLAVNISGS